MNKLDTARRSGFNGARSKSGEWIVIKNKKKRNWQKIENKPPVMTHMLSDSHSSSSEDLQAGIDNDPDNDLNEEPDDYQDGEEGDDEIENDEPQQDEEDDDENTTSNRSGKMFHQHHQPMHSSPLSHSRGHPHPHLIRMQPASKSTEQTPPTSSPLLPFPPGFRPNQTFKNVPNLQTDNRYERKAMMTPKQTEKISTTGFCRYFLQGYCRDGKRCVFSHDAAQLKRTQSDPQALGTSSSLESTQLPQSQVLARSIYRSQSSSTEMSTHPHPHRNHDLDQEQSDDSSRFQLESIMVSPPLRHSMDERVIPPFASPAASTISDPGSERSAMGLFSTSASSSPFTLLPATPSIPVPLPHALSGGTYSLSNPTSPFASSMSPESLGGLSTFRLNGGAYSHVTARGLTGKTISRSLSRPSTVDSYGTSPAESRSRSLTSTSEGSSSWNSQLFPRSAPSHFYAYDSPLGRSDSFSSALSNGISSLRPSPESSPFPSMDVSSVFLSSSPALLPASSPALPLSISSPLLTGGGSTSVPVREEDPVKFEEDAKHADLDLKLVELALSDGPDSILLDQHSSDETEVPENNGNQNTSASGGSNGSVELASVPSASSFDPTELNLNLSAVSMVSLPLSKIAHTSQEISLSENPSNLSSGDDSPSDSPSPHHQQSRSLMISLPEEPIMTEGDHDPENELDPIESSSLPSSKPIPIPGSSPSYSSIVRASSSPVLTSSPVSIKKSPPTKQKDDIKSILPVAALSDKKGRKVCSFFLQGICRYGQQCRHRHLHCVSDKCLSCGQTCGSTPEEQQAHLTLCTEVVAMEKERRDSASKKCGICHQLTLKLNRKFGLLISCNHSFCLQCIREWRGSSEHSRERVRACPVCKVVSHYVIPCDRHVDQPTRKQRVIVEYKWRLGQIDCKHYNRGKSVCPFGDACFYRHEESPPIQVGNEKLKTSSRRLNGPKTYSEGIFDDEEDEEEEDESNEVISHRKHDESEQHGHSHDSLLRERPGAPLLKFAKKRMGVGSNHSSPSNPKNKLDLKAKKNNGKYVKGKSKNKK